MLAFALVGVGIALPLFLSAAPAESVASPTPAPTPASGSEPGQAMGATSPASGAASQPAPAQPQAPPPAATDYTQITRVVGEVGDRFVTSREIRINHAIAQALGATDAAILTGQEKAFSAEVARSLDEWAIYLEAKGLATSEVPRAEVAKAVKTVQDRWEGKPGWQALEVSPAELREITERKLVARGFLGLKSDSSLIPISDSDAAQYYRRNRLRFGSTPFSAVKENIRAYLLKQQTDKRIEDWKEVLRRKYKIRNFLAG